MLFSVRYYTIEYSETYRKRRNIMKKKLLSLLLVLVLVPTAVLCGCNDGQSSGGTSTTPESSSGTPVSGGEITVGIATDLYSSLDPHVSSSTAGTREVLFNIFEGLLKPDSDGNLVPAIAESYTVNDTADEYTFVLRQGVKFHNGAAVTVGDVVYSITRAAGLETGEPLMSVLSGVTAVETDGDRTVTITLSAPDTEFAAYCTAAIIPEGNDPAEELIGTGPFMFVSRTPGEQIVLDKFADYWGTPAYLDRVTLKVIENSETLIMSLRSGAIDLTTHLEYSQVANLSGLNILQDSMHLVQALYLNHSYEPFADARVRQALCYAIDKHAIIELAGDGNGTALGSSMYPAFGRYFMDELTDYYEYNPDKARELLAEAGYEDLSFSIAVISSYTPHVDTASVIVEQLRAVGVEATIDLMESETWLSEVYQGHDFEATITGMDASTLTASALLYRFTSDSPKNFISFQNADYDTAYAAAVASTDTEAQTEYFKACETILTEEAANVYIQDLAEFVAMQSDLAGFKFYPLSALDLAAIYYTE